MLEHNNEHTFNLKEKERKRIERQKREEKERGCIIVYTISLLAVQNQIQSIYFVQKTNIRFHPIREQLPW